MAKDIVHKWIVPVLYASLWASGLYLSQNIDVIFPFLTSFESTQIEIFSFAIVFVIFFIELIIMLLDTYMTIGSYTLSPKFILFMCVFMILFVIFLYLIVGFSAAKMDNSDNVINNAFTEILILSTLMKLLEILIQNNPQWLLEKIQTTQINTEKRNYVNRNILL